MTFKLKVGMAFDPDKARAKQVNLENIKKPKKKLKLPKELFSKIPWVDIVRSFAISALIIANVFMIGIAVVWFGVLFSFISPGELMSMYGIEPTSAVVVEETFGTELSEFKMPPAPALGGN